MLVKYFHIKEYDLIINPISLAFVHGFNDFIEFLLFSFIVIL